MIDDHEAIMSHKRERTEAMILLKRHGYTMTDFLMTVNVEPNFTGPSLRETVLAFLVSRGIDSNASTVTEPFTATEVRDIFEDDRRRMAKVIDNRLGSMPRDIDISIHLEKDDQGQWYGYTIKSPDDISQELRPSFSKRLCGDTKHQVMKPHNGTSLPFAAADYTRENDGDILLCTSDADILASIDITQSAALSDKIIADAWEIIKSDDRVCIPITRMKPNSEQIGSVPDQCLLMKIIKDRREEGDAFMEKSLKDIETNADNDLKTRIELEIQPFDSADRNSRVFPKPGEKSKKADKEGDGENDGTGKLEYFTE